jgi:hypothetical protein
VKDIQRKSDRTYYEAWFSRINWTAHLLPTAKLAAKSFFLEMDELKLDRPHLSVLSEDANAGYFDKQEEEIWTDSVSFTFGARPIPAKAVVPVKGRVRTLVEERACLVLSQSLSGSVVALIYPPSSEAAKPIKPFYMAACWNNPNEASKEAIVKLLRLTTEADYYCGAANYPNGKGQRILATLEAKDSVLAQGGSRLWVWFKFALRLSKGVLRLHGIGSPVPSSQGA